MRNKILNSLSILGIVIAIAVPCLVLDTSNYINKTEIIFTYSFYIIGTWLVFAFFIILPTDLALRYYSKKENAKVAFELEINSFTNRNLPQLAENLIKLQSIKEEIETKKNNLSEVLNNLNRNVSQDNDIINWNKLLEEITQSIDKLIQQRNEAFIAYKKSDLPNSDYKSIITNIENQSSLEAKNIENRYVTLRKEIEQRM